MSISIHPVNVISSVPTFLSGFIEKDIRNTRTDMAKVSGIVHGTRDVIRMKMNYRYV